MVAEVENQICQILKKVNRKDFSNRAGHYNEQSIGRTGTLVGAYSSQE